ELVMVRRDVQSNISSFNLFIGRRASRKCPSSQLCTLILTELLPLRRCLQTLHGLLLSVPYMDEQVSSDRPIVLSEQVTGMSALRLQPCLARYWCQVDRARGGAQAR